MKLAAAHGIAGVIPESELSEEYIVPSVFDRRVVEAVAAAVAGEAGRAGIARTGLPGEIGASATLGVRTPAGG